MTKLTAICIIAPIMFYSNIFVFSELQANPVPLFQLYKLADDENSITPDKVITQEELELLLDYE